jgi:hypothetical protein
MAEKRSEGGVVLPGPGAVPVPVDPSDPTKGNITPVASAIELTAGVTELFSRTEQLAQMAVGVAQQQQQGFYEVGEYLDAIACLVIEGVKPFYANGELTDEADEAYNLLKQYRADRAEAKAEADRDAEAETWKANAAEEPLVPGEED